MTDSSSQNTRRRTRLDTGLYRRVTSTGETRYDVAVWQGGRQTLRALPPGTTERQARAEALKARATVANGGAPLGSAVRLDTVVNEYLDAAEHRTQITGKGKMSETTVTTYRTRLRDYVRPTIGNRKLSQLGRADVLKVVDRCHEASLSEWATHGVLTALRAVLRFAREADYMAHDPFASVPRHRLPAQKSCKETRALRPEDAALLIAELRGPRDVALGCLLVDAGLRVSEALGLTWADVSLTEGVLKVRQQLARTKAGEAARLVPTKSSRGIRTIPMLPRLQAALEQLYGGEDDAELVLRTRRGTALSRHNAARSIREAARAGDVRPRHAAGSATARPARRCLRQASRWPPRRRSWATRWRSFTATT